MTTASEQFDDNDSGRAQEVAGRYRREFVDLRGFQIQRELLMTVPVELMFRYNFVPLELSNGTLEIAVADPSQLMMIDEISLLLNKHINVKVSSLRQIKDVLKRTGARGN